MQPDLHVDLASRIAFSFFKNGTIIILGSPCPTARFLGASMAIVLVESLHLSQSWEAKEAESVAHNPL